MPEPDAVERKATTLYFLIAAGVLAVIVAAAILVTRRAPSGASSGPVLSDEQKAYLGQIEVTDAKMSAAENFLGHTVTYLDAVVANKGWRAVKSIELELVFVDTLRQVVLRETAHPITARTPPLKPGETRPFQVTFEHMPIDWNQGPPRIRPVSVEF
ncbi:MAG TPA: hypothetical protein VM182_00775 [Terriglobia bacterium]|nr:hypothetical protein [Terriglobia bacterium]